MKLLVVLLVVGFDLITITTQEKEHLTFDIEYGILNHLTKKRCDPQHLEVRMKVMSYYDRLIELCGFTSVTTPCPTFTTTTCPTFTTTPCPTSTSTTITTTSTTTTTTTTTTPCTADLTPLIAATNGMAYYYTTNEADVAAMAGFTTITSPGQVSNMMACTCEDSLVPIYYAVLPANGDYFYSQFQEEIVIAMGFGYVDMGIAFFCSPVKGRCGATLPLYRFTKGAYHLEVSDQDMTPANTATYDSTRTCYVWPSV